MSAIRKKICQIESANALKEEAGLCRLGEFIEVPASCEVDRRLPEVYQNMIRVENLQALVMPDSEARWDLNGISDDITDDYEAYAPMQNSHFVDSDEHWAPSPKRLERIGCYATASWLPKDSEDGPLSC